MSLINQFDLKILSNKSSHVLILIIFKANYYQADNFCRSHCMSLVSIESEEIHNGIIKYIRESRKYLILILSNFAKY